MIADHGAGVSGSGTDHRKDKRLAVAPTGLSDWHDAQAEHAALLAEAALAVGAFRERMRTVPKGALCRILFWQATVVAAVQRESVPVDLFALMRAGHMLGANAGQPGFVLASAVLDVLEGPRSDMPETTPDTARLHPLIRAAVVLHQGDADGAMQHRAIALAHAIRLTEHVTDAMPGFVPFSPGAWPSSFPKEQLVWWLDGMRAGCAEVMEQLAVLECWSQRAERVLAGWSGRIPSRLVRVIAAWPLVSASLAEAESQASRAAVQRNLDRLEREGLVREVTGQDRYRLWTARFDHPSPTPAQSSPD